MRKVIFFFVIYMVKEKTCGEAALRSYLQTLYRCSEAGYFPFQSDCSSLFLMKEELKRCGVDSEAYRVEKNSALLFSKPFMALLQKDGLFHFVLVLFFSRLFVMYFDPAEGMKFVRRKKFKDLFAGKVLIGKLKERKAVPDVGLFKEKEKIILFFLLLLASACLGFFYFSVSSFPFLAGFFSLLGSALFFYLEKAYLLKIEKRISFKVESPYLSLKGKEGLPLFEKYKRRVILDTEERIETFCSLLLTLYFLYFCPMEEVYLSVFYFLYACVLYLSFLPLLKRGILKLGKEEKETFEGEYKEGMFRKTVQTGQKEGAAVLLMKLLFFVPAVLFVSIRTAVSSQESFVLYLPFFFPLALTYSLLNRRILSLGKERKEALFYALGKEIHPCLLAKGKSGKKDGI